MKGVSVIRNDGIRGTVINDEDTEKLVLDFNDGIRLIVSGEMLVPQEDGTYHLLVGTTQLANAVESAAIEEEIIIPVVVEEISVETERITRGKVRVNKRVETREEVVNATTIHEKVVVERIPINKIVEGAAPKMRDENGVLIIPVLEEVLVVQKRILLREEVHIIKQRTKESNPQTVQLRREVVEIERTEFNDVDIDQTQEFDNI